MATHLPYRGEVGIVNVIRNDGETFHVAMNNEKAEATICRENF